MKTAAIVIIGNEILSGRVKDTNSFFLAESLRALGVDVRRILVIPDEIDVIGREVAALSAQFSYVFTAGGIGPTHDDVTVEGIAYGFGLRTVENARLLAHIGTYCGDKPNEAARRMALVPEGAVIIEEEGMRFPPIQIRNVYIFPGIPEYLRNKFEMIKERFRTEPFSLMKVYINAEECNIAHIITRCAEEFPDVAVGSYPKLGIEEYKVIVTFESRDLADVERAASMLVGLLPVGSVVRSE